MIVVILSAGSATRLGELTKNLPKGLLDINGKTLVERQIEVFDSNNIEKIILIVGPNRDKFRLENVDYVYDESHNQHEQLGSLFAAKKFCKIKTVI